MVLSATDDQMHSIFVYLQKKTRQMRLVLIQYNTTSLISNIEQNYITTTTIFTQHWDGWKGGGQKNNLIVVQPQH